MKLGRLYQLIVKLGIARDPRGIKVGEYFKKAKKEYRCLKGIEKTSFDMESLRNPFADTRILYGNPDAKVKRILVGIDIEAPEILLADKIRERQGLDLVVSHHPEGIAYAGLAEVMQVHSVILQKLGLQKEVVDDFLKERVQEVSRKVSPANHSRAVDAARLLDMPFMSCHTPSDNFVARYLQARIDKSKPEKVSDVCNALYKISEYRESLSRKAGPKVILGKAGNRAGKVFVDMTGGTEGPNGLFGRLSQAGVSTLVCMHLSEEHFAKAKTEHLNVIVAGHIASDTLGLNLLFDEIEKIEKLDIICCSGFKRIKERRQ